LHLSGQCVEFFLDRLLGLAVELGRIQFFQFFSGPLELPGRQRLARFGHRFGQGQRIANGLQLGIDLADVELGLLLLQGRLHL
jgi:hypothetical protein